MFRLLLAGFICIPIIEIYLLIHIGGFIGAIPTIGLVLLTAVIGVYLLRQQGLATLGTIQSSLDRHELPAVPLVEGLILLVAGAFLLTPGFFTDSVGFLCLVPRIRQALAAQLLRYFVLHHVTEDGEQAVVIEGEFYNEGDEKKSRIETLDRE